MALLRLLRLLRLLLCFLVRASWKQVNIQTNWKKASFLAYCVTTRGDCYAIKRNKWVFTKQAYMILVSRFYKFS